MPPRRQDVAGDFDKYFGNVSRLENWQRLCHDVHVLGAYNLRSIKACKEALSKVYVNIHDLIDANRNGTRVGVFKTRRELIEYTAKHQKYFPLRRAKEGGPVRGLLVKMRE